MVDGTKGVRTIGPPGLERNLGQRAKVVFPEKRGDRSANWAGELVENPCYVSSPCVGKDVFDGSAPYAVRVRFGAGNRALRYIPVEHGCQMRIMVDGKIKTYVFIDDSD